MVALLTPVDSFGYTEEEKKELMKIPPKEHSLEDYAAMIANRAICDSIDKIRESGVIPKFKKQWNDWVRRQEIEQEEWEQSHPRK